MLTFILEKYDSDCIEIWKIKMSKYKILTFFLKSGSDGIEIWEILEKN